jgi:S1-C subfamily serine protease
MSKRAVLLSIAVTAWACLPPPKPLPSLPTQSHAANLPSTPPSDKALQVKLKAFVIDVPMGHVYGQEAWGFQGSSCTEQRNSVNTEGRFEFDVAKYGDVFKAVLMRRGFPVEDDLELFAGTKKRVADLQVAARVIDATLNECYPDVSRNKLKATGSAWLKVEWSLYSTLEKKIVVSVVTEGSTYGQVASTIGQPGILRPAFEDAVERLARSDAFRKAVDPPSAPTAAAQVAGSARIRLRCARGFSGGMQANIEAIRRAVATVTANGGSGSGFVVSEDGKVVTAEHVVSGSRYVKVTTGAGKECYGEVVASSKQRDLALVSVDCAGLTALPLARKRMAEGFEVFAVGTPLSEKLRFSVTKGVVSGIRKFDELEYIQSDVTVLPGSSGGPLLDTAGNAVGVTTRMLSAGAVPVGVNFFVPLWDLDKFLPVDVVD